MKSDLLIVGAGPTGLTAAVELARRGITPRVIDKKDRFSSLSRAVGINALALNLFHKSGLSKKFIDRGVKVREARFFVRELSAFSLNLGLAPKPYDFLLALPQDQTEQILMDEFETLGGKVQFGVELVALDSKNDQNSVKLRHFADGTEERAECEYVFGADGLRSRVRDSVGIEFNGIELSDKWSIVDFDSSTWPYKSTLCLFVYDRGRVCLVVPIGRNRYRGVTDRPNAVERMPSMLEIENVRREGNFTIWVKQAPVFQKANVFIGGDAAHCHSPVGGRGMNLGMADGMCFARHFAGKGLENYTAERHDPAAKTIAVTERARRFATSNFALKIFVLDNIIPFLLKSTYLHRRVVRAALDVQEKK